MASAASSAWSSWVRYMPRSSERAASCSRSAWAYSRSRSCTSSRRPCRPRFSARPPSSFCSSASSGSRSSQPAVTVASGASGSRSRRTGWMLGRRCGPRSVTDRVTCGSRHVHVDGAPHVVQHPAQDVVVVVAHADVGVGHVSGLDPSRGRALARQVRVEHPLAVPGLHLLYAGVAGDAGVALGAQRDDTGRVSAGRPGRDMSVHDRVGPLAVQVEVVAGRVQVPGADARRPAADLGELEPFRPEEPFHVRGTGADAEGLGDAVAELAELGIVRDRVHPVGGDELRRDPSGPHRLQHVRVVVRHEVERCISVDRQSVVEPLVAIHELLDRDRGDALAAEHRQRRVELLPVVDAGGVQRSGSGARLQDDRKPHRLDECTYVFSVVSPGRGSGRYSGRTKRFLHRRFVAAQPCRAQGGPGNGAALPHLGRRECVRLDGRLQAVYPEPVLQPAHRVCHHTHVDHVRNLVVVRHPAPQLVVQVLLRGLADADHLGADLGQGAYELALVLREARLDEDHSHPGMLARTPRGGCPQDRRAGNVRTMVAAAFVAPYLLEATARFVRCAASLSGARLGLVPSEPLEGIPPELRSRLAGHWRVDNALDPRQIAEGVAGLSRQMGRIDRLVGALEQLQVPLAQVREALGIEGMDVSTAVNVRDKPRMKEVLQAAGVPCARHALVHDAAQAKSFAAEVGFPLVAKPPAGAGSQATYRLDDDAALHGWVNGVAPRGDAPGPPEGFLVGDEHTFDSVTLEGTTVWSSIADYHPPPLEVLRNPWIQWMGGLPRDPSGPEYAGIHEVGPAALRALGVTDALTHMDWFRRPDGSVAVSEVAARPPGAQLTSMHGYVHDFDLYTSWARLAVLGSFDVPERRFAAGTAYLRGMGHGRVRAVHGVDELNRQVGHLVVESRLPRQGEEASTEETGQGDGVGGGP